MAGKIVVSTLNNDTGVLATQNGMTGICKAWVNFNGTGTPAIRGSFNVSSITDNGTGDFTVNFTTAMPNTTYSVGGSANMTDNPAGGDADDGISYGPTVYTTTSIRGVVGRTNAPQDAVNINVQVFSS